MGEINVLTSEQRSVLVAILNRIIPAEGVLPGAGDLGLVNFIERSIATSPESRRLFLDGIGEIEVIAWRHGNATFHALTIQQQDEVLTLVETTRPDFFSQLVDRAYQGYYVDPRALAAIGHDPRPPQPLGYTLPAFDPSLLDRVRARGPLFRVVEP